VLDWSNSPKLAGSRLPPVFACYNSSVAKIQFVAWATIFVLIASATMVRFVGLDRSPPGFFHDEAASAVNVISIAQTGFDRAGRLHPLFPASDDGGFNSPTHTYLAILWTDLFGYSIESFRSLSGVTTTITVIGIFFLTRLLAGYRAAILAVLSASISPWAFQWARQACDDPTLYPCAVVWGTYFLLRGVHWRNQIAAGLCFSVALYDYPAALVSVPLIIIALLCIKRMSRVLPLALTLLICCVPLIRRFLSGQMFSRYQHRGVFSSTGTVELGSSNLAYKLFIIARNFMRQFFPDYLFITGDKYLWHASQFCGQLSWLDELAIVLAAFLLLGHVRAGRSLRPPARLLIVVAGVLSSVLPSALTIDPSPNSLRAVAAWPFFSLLTGLVLARATRQWRMALPAASVVAALFAVLFWNYYFTDYVRYSYMVFHVRAQEFARKARRSGDWNEFITYIRPLDQPLGRFYLMAWGHWSVEQSRQVLPDLLPASDYPSN
jgi:4-amino-4-deoxy-L-arabinose transferase-like glycosyltransferase